MARKGTIAWYKEREEGLRDDLRHEVKRRKHVEDQLKVAQNRLLGEMRENLELKQEIDRVKIMAFDMITMEVKSDD